MRISDWSSDVCSSDLEVNVPARYGLDLWKTLYEAGRKFGITPYGTETMHVLRAEKGYIIVGQDTDGTVTPDDAGLSWARSEEHTSELQSLMRSSYAVFCLKKKH